MIAGDENNQREELYLHPSEFMQRPRRLTKILHHCGTVIVRTIIHPIEHVQSILESIHCVCRSPGKQRQ